MFILLTYLGACHPEFPYVTIRKASGFLIIAVLFLFKGLWVIPYSNRDFYFLRLGVFK